LLGRGGMGRVFEAHRVDEHIKQIVAIKFFDVALADERTREAASGRFLQERRILATLQHPYIGALIDAGTFNGIPYFVMERVDGIPIDRFVEDHQLGIRDCIDLVLKVGQAVERAHQNLIVHRDIKPNNILVTADGIPKLLDFGIAKELLNITGSNTILTPLTPAYASPEQVAGGAITVATDVYGLGALLYRLLTGHAPHPLLDFSPADWLRIVMERDVIAPSFYHESLRGDLENVLRKALHRDPDRRYDSVRTFADDLRRFLNSRTVLATPDSLAYRTRMVLRRNKLLAVATALAAVSLIAGTAVSLNQGRRAQHRFDQVRQLANVFLFDFERSIRNTPGTLEARQFVASTSQRYLQELAADARYDPSLQREIAQAYERLADIQGALQAGGGRSRSETDSLLEALKIRRHLGDDQSSVPSLRRQYIDLVSLLAVRFQDAKNAPESAKWADEAMDLSERWTAAEPHSVDALAAATVAFTRGANTQEVGGQIDRALQSLNKASAFGGRAVAGAPNDQAIGISASYAERVYSELLVGASRSSEALSHGQRALVLIEPLWEQRPRDPSIRAGFVNANSAVGISLRGLAGSDVRKLAAGVPYLQRAYDITKETMLADPKSARAKSDFVVECQRLSDLLTDMKNFDDAAALYEQADQVAHELAKLDPENRRSWYMLGKNQLDLGWMFLESGRLVEARRAFLASDEGLLRGLMMDPQDAVILECRAGQFEGLARAAMKSGAEAESRRWMIQCLDVMRGMVRRDASAKSYIYDYSGKLDLARKLALSTEGLE
jgi:eukaryotic-like serine/threonine-protein kinase